MQRVLRDPVIRRVLVACLLVGQAYGLTISTLALYLRSKGHSEESIGWLATTFAIGIAGFSIPSGFAVTRWGARSILVLSFFGYAAVTAALPLLPSFALVAASRVLDGAFSAGVWTSSESTLLARASRTHKALVTTIYAISLSIGYVTGPILAIGIGRLAPKQTVFYAAALLATAAGLIGLLLPSRPDAVPDSDPAPEHPSGRASESSRSSFHEMRSPLVIFFRIKTACAAVFAYGYFQSALVLFLVIYLTERRGFTEDEAKFMMAPFAFGMLVFSNLVGRVADRVGHQRTLSLLTSVGAATIGGFYFLHDYWLMVAAVSVAGATLGAVWPVSLALQGVLVHPHEYARSNSIANVFYAAGMILGPVLAARIYQRIGAPWLFWHLALLWLGVTAMAVLTGGDDQGARVPTSKR